MRIRWTHAFLPVVMAGALGCAAAEDGDSSATPTEPTPGVTTLTNKVEVPARNGIYKISVPANQAYVLIIARNQNGMVMDVARGQVATSTYYACHETQKDTNDQICSINNPGAVDVYITLSNVTSSAAVISASYEPSVNTSLFIQELKSGVTLGSQSGLQGEWNYYSILVPASASGQQKLEVKVSGTNGDADLFVGQGVSPEPGKLIVNCSSVTLNTSNESCSFNPPVVNHIYYIAVKATKLFIGMSITATVGSGTVTTPPPPTGGSGCQAQWGTTLSGTWRATSYIIIASEYIPSSYSSVKYEFGTTSYKATYTPTSGSPSIVSGSYTVQTNSAANSVGGNRCAIVVPMSDGTSIVMKIMSYTGGVLEVRDDGNPNVPVFVKMVKQ